MGFRGQDDTEDYLSCFKPQSPGKKWRILKAIASITAKVSYNQCLGYRKLQRSLNVEPLLPATLSPNLGKTQKHSGWQDRGSTPPFPRTLTVSWGNMDVIIKE